MTNKWSKYFPPFLQCTQTYTFSVFSLTAFHLALLNSFYDAEDVSMQLSIKLVLSCLHFIDFVLSFLFYFLLYPVPLFLLKSCHHPCLVIGLLFNCIDLLCVSHSLVCVYIPCIFKGQLLNANFRTKSVPWFPVSTFALF